MSAANKTNSSHYLQTDGESQHLSAGDLIRVRSEEEIQATLTNGMNSKVVNLWMSKEVLQYHSEGLKPSKGLWMSVIIG